MKAVLFDAGNTLLSVDHPFVVAVLSEQGVETTADELIAAEGERIAALHELPELLGGAA
ncbi:MAG TPA: hypothetical protein VF771_04495 [Longimicrobiaceae bacterium]